MEGGRRRCHPASRGRPPSWRSASFRSNSRESFASYSVDRKQKGLKANVELTSKKELNADDFGRWLHLLARVVELGHLGVLSAHLADVEHLALLHARTLTYLLVLRQSLASEVPATHFAWRHDDPARLGCRMFCCASVKVDALASALLYNVKISTMKQK